MANYEIVLVDDDPLTLTLEQDVLSAAGMHAKSFTNPFEAWQYIEKTVPRLVVTDSRMPGMSGMELLFKTRGMPIPPHVIIATGFGTVEHAVTAMNEGAFNFIEKPFKAERFLSIVQESLRTRMDGGPRGANSGRSSESPSGRIIAGANRPTPVAVSPSMRRVLELARSASSTDSSILLLGETGTGKEVLADFIHYNSPRSRGPLVKINCGAMPEHLLESELFGHEKGAFTGADRRKIGRFEAANDGTIMLDEIGDLLQPLQVKILRVLQQRMIERLGDNKSVPVDFRLICATHRNLENAVAAGQFREDLYYRINVIPIHLPPLRERREDIEPLAVHILDNLSKRMKVIPEGFTRSAIGLLTEFDFPGNVRQLCNAVEYALVMCQERLIDVHHLPESLRKPSIRSTQSLLGLGWGSGSHPPLPAHLQHPPQIPHVPYTSPTPLPMDGPKANDSQKISFKKFVQDAEADAIHKALDKHNWVVAEVARELNISRTVLYERMKAYGIKRPERGLASPVQPQLPGEVPAG